MKGCPENFLTWNLHLGKVNSMGKQRCPYCIIVRSQLWVRYKKDATCKEEYLVPLKVKVSYCPVCGKKVR